SATGPYPQARAETMKQRDFTERQIVEILREARQTSVGEAARKHRVTEATIPAWLGKFGRLGAEDIKGLRHLKFAQARRKGAAVRAQANATPDQTTEKVASSK